MIELQTYTDADFPLIEALETDPEAMRHLGGPIDRERLAKVHRTRLEEPFWFKVTDGGESVGTIGIWETKHGEETIHEAGWMVLPAHQGRGIATAALAQLIERARAEPTIERVHAFPPVDNAPSNALCRKFGFVLLGEEDFVYAGRTLHCNDWALDTRS
jgi:RimJ/RimL family protein N-acetyltransferase